MKKILSVSTILLLLVVAYSSCKKKSNTDNNTNTGKIVTVDIGYGDTTTLPTAIPALPMSLDFMNTPIQVDTFATKVDEFITPYKFTKNDIIKVNLKELNVRLENVPGQYFNFVKDTTPISIKIYIDSFSGTTPKMVASKTSIPQNVQELVMEVSPDDIKDYFRSEYMKVLIAFRTEENQGLDAAAKFRFNFTFTVTANQP